MISSTRSTTRQLFRYGIWSELSNLFRMLSELLLINLWLFSLTLEVMPWAQSFLVLVVIYLGSYLLARLFHYLDWKLSLQRGLFLAWVAAVLALASAALLFNHIPLTPTAFFRQLFQTTLSAETVLGFWILLAALVAMLRGLQIARYPVSARELIVGIRVSLILFSAYAIVFGRIGTGPFLPSFLFFMLFNLAGLSLARVADLSDNHGSRLPGFNLQWASGIGLAAILVVLLGIIASWVINLNVAQFLGRGLVLLLQLVLGAIVLITSPILLAVVSVVQFLLQLIAPNLESLLNPADLEAGNKLLEDIQSQITETTRTDPRLFIMIGVLALFVIVAIIQLRWKPWERFTRGEEGASDLEVNFQAPRPFRNLFQRRGRPKRRKSAQSLIAAARVRYVYAQLMELCEHLGKPRPRSTTPIEFLPRMVGLFPMHQAELELITNAYIRVRYGELPETSAEIEDVLEAWRQISQFGKEIIDERNKNLRRSSAR